MINQLVKVMMGLTCSVLLTGFSCNVVAAQLVLWYPFTDAAQSTTIHDASGQHHNGLVVGNATLEKGAIHLDGDNSYIQLPANLMDGLDAITIMTKVYIEPTQQSPYFIYGLGNSGEQYGDGYLFTTGNFYRTSISDCNWSCEQNAATPTQNLSRGEWHHLAYTLGNGTAVLYLDGQEVARNDNITLTPQDIGSGSTTANYLGRSLYSADHYFHGAFADFQIWDHPLSAQAVQHAAQLAMPELTDIGAVFADTKRLDVTHIEDARSALYLPTIGEYGSTISWHSSRPNVVSNDGLVHRAPFGGKTRHSLLMATIRKGHHRLVKFFYAKVPPLPQKADYAGYLFTYFTGEGYRNGEQIYAGLSVGNDPLNWQTLNEEQPILTSTLGEQGARDPFIIRSPEGDTFYLIATDLKIYGNGDWNRAVTNGSQSLLVWESNDLVNWSEPRLIKVSPDTAGNTWAPEAYWDPERQYYVVFWASEIYDNTLHNNSTYHKMMYALTRDFVHFTPAKVWVDNGYSTIDSTLIENKGIYYRFTKDERGAAQTQCGKFILSETSTSLSNLNWDFQAECIGAGAISRGEGPLVFKANNEEKWYLFIDEYGARGYVPFETDDLTSGQWTIENNYQLPSRPRHGTVLPITQQEYDRVQATWQH